MVVMRRAWIATVWGYDHVRVVIVCGKLENWKLALNKSLKLENKEKDKQREACKNQNKTKNVLEVILRL